MRSSEVISKCTSTAGPSIVSTYNSPNHLKIFKTTVMSICPFICAPRCVPVSADVIQQTSSLSGFKFGLVRKRITASLRFTHRITQHLKAPNIRDRVLLWYPRARPLIGFRCDWKYWTLWGQLTSAWSGTWWGGYGRCSYTSSLLCLFSFPDSAFPTCFASNNKWP